MNDFETAISGFYRPGELEKIQHITVGIAGAGGIGSNCALMLVRSGFRNLTIADFDSVTASNLNRQQYTLSHIGKPKAECLKNILLSINPDVSITTIPARVAAENVQEIFGNCAIVIEAFDCAESKAMLFSSLLHSDKVIIGVSGIGGFGNCSSIKVLRVSDKAFIVGDGVSEVNEVIKPFAPRVTMVSAMMADMVLTCAVRGYI